MKKISVIYTSVGLGHKLVGQSIAQALRGYKELEVLELDFLKQNGNWFTRGFEKVYIFVINRAGWIWSALYRSRLFNKLTLPLRVPLARAKAGKLQQYLEKHRPDAVVTTQTTASAAMAALKRSGKYSGQFIISFSDFHFHPYWFYREADRVLVQTDEQATALIKLGYPKGQIALTGLPVSQSYEQPHNLRQTLEDYKLSRNKPLIIVMGGSRGWGIRQSDIEELIKISYDVQLVVVAGTNGILKSRLQERARSENLPIRIFGFLPHEELAKLFQAARILVTKPGGSTIGEALSCGLPMVLVNPLPAMEQLNQDFIVRRGAGVSAGSSEELRRWVERLLQDKKLYDEMRARAKKLYHQGAAARAAGAIIDTLSK